MTVARRRAMLGAAALVLMALAFTAGRLSPGFGSISGPAATWTIDGYRIDDDWGEVARGLSCSDTERAWRGHRRWCLASDDLDLYFDEDDLLVEMVYEIPLQASTRNEVDPSRLWLEVRDAVRPILGEANTVTDVVGDEVGRRLDVFWRIRDQCARLEVLGRPYAGDHARAVLTMSRCEPDQAAPQP